MCRRQWRMYLRSRKTWATGRRRQSRSASRDLSSGIATTIRFRFRGDAGGDEYEYMRWCRRTGLRWFAAGRGLWAQISYGGVRPLGGKDPRLSRASRSDWRNFPRVIPGSTAPRVLERRIEAEK